MHGMRHAVSVMSSASTYTSVESPARQPFPGHAHGHLVLSQPSSCLSPTVAFKSKKGQGYIDYRNLYIKNIDSGITNKDLFSIFRTYGQIVSARIMSNPVTGQSKGFGFVSYTHIEEAAAALRAMHGQVVGSKQLTVAYHEPRKLRTMSPAATAFVSPDQQHHHHIANASPAAAAAVHGSSVPPRIQHNPRFTSLDSQSDVQIPGHDARAVVASTSASTPTHRPYAHADKDTIAVRRSRTRKQTEGSTAKYPVSIAAEMTIKNPTPPGLLQQHTYQAGFGGGVGGGEWGPTPAQSLSPAGVHQHHDGSQQPLSPWNHAVSSGERGTAIASDSIQRTRLAEAAARLVTSDCNLDQVVDLLRTMSTVDQSLCLFNPNFLSQKLQLVMDAIRQSNDPAEQVAIFVASGGHHDPSMGQPSNARPPPQQQLPQQPFVHPASDAAAASAVASPRRHRHGDGSSDVQPAPASTYLEFAPDPDTCYTPVAEPASLLPDISPKGQQSSPPAELLSEFALIQEKLEQMKGASILQRRQMLGDHLYPYVKRTGVRRAPQVTVHLLDMVKPEQLAIIMFDEPWLNECVRSASAEVERRQQ